MDYQSENAHVIEQIDQLVQICLNLKQWSFQEETRFINKKFPAIIYKSQWCYMKVVSEGQDELGAYTVSMSYGRLHADLNSPYLMWNGENCHCWHNIPYILHFLDGHTPNTIARKNYQRPQVMEQFRQSEMGQKLKGRQHQPEWLLRMHASIWDRYGLRLFELFDLRRPDLWRNYREFMQGLYDIEGRSPNINPPLDHIC